MYIYIYTFNYLFIRTHMCIARTSMGTRASRCSAASWIYTCVQCAHVHDELQDAYERADQIRVLLTH